MNIYITSLKENFPKPISKVYSLKGGKNDKRDGMLICYLYRFKIAWVILSIFKKKKKKKEKRKIAWVIVKVSFFTSAKQQNNIRE